jgi:hypothetical protein
MKNSEEIKLILAIMQGGHGYRLENETGILTFGENNQTIKVKANNYEVAYVINAMLYNADQDIMKGVFEAKKQIVHGK